MIRSLIEKIRINKEKKNFHVVDAQAIDQKLTIYVQLEDILNEWANVRNVPIEEIYYYVSTDLRIEATKEDQVQNPKKILNKLFQNWKENLKEFSSWNRPHINIEVVKKEKGKIVGLNLTTYHYSASLNHCLSTGKTLKQISKIKYCNMNNIEYADLTFDKNEFKYAYVKIELGEWINESYRREERQVINNLIEKQLAMKLY